MDFEFFRIRETKQGSLRRYLVHEPMTSMCTVLAERQDLAAVQSRYYDNLATSHPSAFSAAFR